MQRLLNKYIQFGMVCNKKLSGRPKINDPRDERAIKRICLKDRMLSVAAIKKYL